MSPLLSLLLLSGWASTPTDTLMDVRQGDRLLFRDLDGHVTIEVWDEPQLEAEVYVDEGGSVTFYRRGSRIETRLSGRRARRDVEIRLRIPSWLAVDIEGRDLYIRARGLDSDFSVRALSAELVMQDMAGSIDVYASDGEIDASGLDGRAHLRVGDADLVIRDSHGELEIETVDGEIRLVGMATPNLSARSTDGEIDFQGSFLGGGTYSFYSHSGDITLRPAPPMDVSARVLSYGGEFASDFQVRARGIKAGEGLEFTLGEGSATLTVETFDGDIRLHDENPIAKSMSHVSFPRTNRGVKR